jgi:hypothetical protein
MQITSLTTIDQTQIKQWITDRLTVQKLEELLQSKGFDAEMISLHLKEFNKQRYELRRSKGFTYASAGAVLGFVGCVLAILNPMPELYYLGLYGFTSLAAILIFMGLYFLFE